MISAYPSSIAYENSVGIVKNSRTETKVSFRLVDVGFGVEIKGKLCCVKMLTWKKENI